MMLEEFSEKHIFMMCEKPKREAFKCLPIGFHVRHCKEDELNIWKNMHFDTAELANEYFDFMTDFFNNVYKKQGDLFFKRCLFVCNEDDLPVGTCFIWKSYNKISTIHWFKVKKEYEGLGLGRGILSIVMEGLPHDEYPVFLHTHPTSYRAIKLYSDFGFDLLTDPIIGNRTNDIKECLPFLEKYMHNQDFRNLKFRKAPNYFLDVVKSSDVNEF